MGQWVILYFFISLLTGAIALSSITQVILESRERLLREFLLFFSVFTLMILVSLFYYYVTVNIPNPSGALIRILIILSTSITSLFVYTLARYTNMEKNLDGIRWLDYALIILSLTMFFSGIFSMKPDLQSPGYIKQVQPWAVINSAIFVLILVFVFLPFNIPSPEKKIHLQEFSRSFQWLSYLFMPFIFADIVLNTKMPVRFYPLLYSAYAVLLTVFLNRNRKKFYNRSAVLVPEDAFYTRFGISRREKEVLLLILQGKTNPQIAKELFISLPTVKTHIQRVFQKTGAASRFELIRFLSSENTIK